MNKLYIIKIGGNVLDDDQALAAFLRDFASIQAPKILIHGGGKIATKLGEQLGIASKYINGRRITDAPTLDLVTMVYGGLINKQIVARLQQMPELVTAWGGIEQAAGEAGVLGDLAPHEAFVLPPFPGQPRPQVAVLGILHRQAVARGRSVNHDKTIIHA